MSDEGYIIIFLVSYLSIIDELWIVMISVEMIGRLGNNMWQYAVCRTIAEDKNYDFHIPRSFSGSELFDCSLGVELDLTNQKFIDGYMHNSFMAQFYNPHILEILDFTKLVGVLSVWTIYRKKQEQYPGLVLT